MAYKMNLYSPFEGMSYIWNVSMQVGVLGTCPNATQDVELVQRLLAQRHKVHPTYKVQRAHGIGFLRSVSGHMDTQTAFEIYWSGSSNHKLSDAETISPARGGTIRYGSGYWTIGYLNWEVFKWDRQVWENLPELCSPPLRNALLTKTTP